MAITVNGEPVRDPDIQRQAEALRRSAGNAPPEQIQQEATRRAIDHKLLRQAALKHEAAPSPGELAKAMTAIESRHGGRKRLLKAMNMKPSQYEELRADVSASMRLERYMGRLCHMEEPTEDALLEHYRKNPNVFGTPETVTASHVVRHVDAEHDAVTAQEQIRQAKAELDAGDDFATVADRYSDCAGSGGHLGSFPRGQMVPDFEQVVFNIKPGTVSDIFRTEFGFHIALVHERTPARMRSYDEVREEVVKHYVQSHQQAAIEAEIARLRQTADIQGA